MESIPPSIQFGLFLVPPALFPFSGFASFSFHLSFSSKAPSSFFPSCVECLLSFFNPRHHQSLES